MTTFGRILSQKQEPQPAASPFDLIDVKIGLLTIKGRPYEIGVSPGGDNGNIEYPTKISTSCPYCGHGIFIDVRPWQLNNLPIIGSCENCHAGEEIIPEKLEDPFRNPVIAGLISKLELNPLYVELDRVLDDNKPTAAEIIKKRRKTKPNTTIPDRAPIADPLPDNPELALQSLLESTSEPSISDVLALGEEEDD